MINWEEHGFVIVGLASDGIEALEMYSLTGPSLVITDIKMPRMDGLTLISQLNKINPELKIYSILMLLIVAFFFLKWT